MVFINACEVLHSSAQFFWTYVHQVNVGSDGSCIGMKRVVHKNSVQWCYVVPSLK
jgi:hypothetical protein